MVVCPGLLEIVRKCKIVSEYNVYAYCFLGNHIHLLLKVGKESLEQIFKRIGARYVYYFNQKYKRCGHLFQDRFKSEPVDDDNYLLTVVRYIHNNPVKAGLSKTGDQYQWSSYNEYLYSNKNSQNLVDVDFVLGLMNRDEFKSFHDKQGNENVLDLEKEHFIMTDDEANMIMQEVCGTSTCDFEELDIEARNYFIKKLKEKGLSIRQLSRITGISKRIIEKISKT